MEQIQIFLAGFSASLWVYVAIFLLSAAEACAVTSFFLSGTIGIVFVGVLIERGVLDPTLAVAAVYFGTLLGDVSTFFLASQLERFPIVKSGLERFAPLRESLAVAPARFIVIGHFVPYLRSVLPVLAAGKVSAPKYLLIEACAAFASSAGIIGLGYSSAGVLRKVPIENALVGISLLAASLLVAMWICARKPFCPLKNGHCKGWMNMRRAIIFYLWFLPWHPIRWLEVGLRGTPSRRLRRALATSFTDVRAGDVFLIRLHAPAPWGRWAHTAMAIDSERFVHGFGKVITVHTIACLPVRYAIAQLRPKCGDDLAQKAAAAARAKIGTRVSIAADRNETVTFSCSSLIAFAYRKVGIELVDECVARIVPDDIFTSPQMTLVRIIATEQVSRLTNRYVFDAREGDQDE